MSGSNIIKVFFGFVFATVSLAANAQFHLGGEFSINYSNEHTSYFSGTSKDREDAFLISLKPKIYWNVGENMQVGGRIGIAFGRLDSGLIYDSEKKEDLQNISTDKAVGWSLSPFFGYRLLNWKAISVWAEANVFVGQSYNVEKTDNVYSILNNQLEYGFQILPVVNFDLTEKLAVQLHLGFISLGWYGTRTDYSDKVVTTTFWDLHKGGFSGLIQGLSDYGISIVKTF